MKPSTPRYESFETFWPFYLSQHLNRDCRTLHFVGTTIALMMFVYFLMTSQFKLIPWCFAEAYFFAWTGHFCFERNRPATFQYPLWSLRGDFKMMSLFYQKKLAEEFRRLGLVSALPNPPPDVN